MCGGWREGGVLLLPSTGRAAQVHYPDEIQPDVLQSGGVTEAERQQPLRQKKQSDKGRERGMAGGWDGKGGLFLKHWASWVPSRYSSLGNLT